MHRTASTVRRPQRSGDVRSPSADYHIRHDPESPANISTTVVHALADVMGRDVSNAGFTLADAIDPDALDRIFDGRDDQSAVPAGHIAFTVQGYRVTVYSSGDIVVTPPTATQSAGP